VRVAGRGAGNVAACCRISEVGMVEYTDRIHAELEFFPFAKPHAFDQVHIQTDIAGAFDPALAKSAELSGSRVHQKKLALRIRNCKAAERPAGGLKRGDIGQTGISNLLKAIEVNHSVGYLSNLADVLGKVSDDDRHVCRVLVQRRGR